MNKKPQSKIDIWERFEWLWGGIFYIAILISFSLATQDNNPIVPIWAVALVTGAMILWHSIGLKIAYRKLTSWGEYPTPRFIVLLGDVIFWFVLVMITPSYYVTLFGLFVQVFRHLPIRYATFTALSLTALMIIEQILDTGELSSLSTPSSWLFLFGGLASILISIWISAIIDQSTQRRDLIDKLEKAQSELAAAERREGVLEERQRLAREIHDTLAQGFTSIVMHLEAAEQALPDDTPTLQRHINQARSTARMSLEQARRVVQDLRPDVLDGHSLPEAIQRTAQGWHDDTDIAIIVQTTGHPLALPVDIEVALLRATQEALNNIHKHAHASDVRVTLSYMDDQVVLDIQDDGVGLDTIQNSRFEGGYGLDAMRERVEQCRGRVELESEKGEGTTVVITIPFGESL